MKKNHKKWEVVESAPMNSVRSGCAAAGLDGHVYVTGGYDGKVNLSTVERFDTNKEFWEVMPARLQTVSLYCAAAVLDGALYVLGGQDNGDESFSSVERYVAFKRRRRAGS